MFLDRKKFASEGVRLIPWLLVLGIPLGAGAQNAVLAICTLCLLIGLNYSDSLKFRGHVYIAGCGFIWLAIATVMNPKNPGQHLWEHLFGYTPFVLLPCLIPTRIHRIPKGVFCAAGCILIGIALLSLSQYIWGWQREGFTIIAGEQRARGTWTHPLTLAYACLLVLPFSTGWLLRNPKQIAAWLYFLAALVILWTTRSRVVLVVSVVLLSMQFFISAQRRTRFVLIGTLVAMVAIVGITKNDISTHFKQTLAGKADRHTNEYPDDRVAFWDVYWHLALQRPFLGHGAHIPYTTREQAYAQIGLADFPKKYAAHNQYLQFFAEGGLPAVIWFLTLLVYWVNKCWKLRDQFIAIWLLIGLVGFSLAIITQSAFQDNEVRYVLTLLLSVSGIFFSAKKPLPPTLPT